MNASYFLGIDIGTQGARVVLIDSAGDIIAEESEGFKLSNESREEQVPMDWWLSCLRSLHRLVASARQVIDVELILAVSVTSTSGTVIPLDADNIPLHHAIMYSDKRSAREGELCRQLALEHNGDGYTGFNSSSGLSKMVWFVNQYPGKAAQIHKWIHATDYIIGMLCGKWAITDFTNVLKSGFDLARNCWPEYLYKKLPLKKSWLPEVQAPGVPVYTIRAGLANALGLPETLVVVAGMTDGCASQVASGAVNPGDWNTTIGTTLVVKGVTRLALKDPEDSLYNHRHPDGYWMPGGASNTGADWVTKDFGNNLEGVMAQAAQLIPTQKIAYPLRQQGERFPFIAPDAVGFEMEGMSDPERFAANMEGVAYIERYAYEKIQKLSGEKIHAIYTAGGASNSDIWLAIRSSVLNLPIYKMKHVTGAFGAAILAASNTKFAGIVEATRALTQIDKEVHPQTGLVAAYNRNYALFLQALQDKGYLKREVHA